MPAALSRCFPAILLAVVAVSTHAADTWKPSKPITFIVANAAGGTGDRTVREIQRVQEELGDKRDHECVD